MLRITEQRPDRAGAPATLVVEGRLAGPYVDELRHAAAGQPRTLALDLAGLSYADDAGVTLLNHLVAAGAQIVRTTAYAATLLGRAP
jgi:ABC-type transporter Mla MlaB component